MISNLKIQSYENIRRETVFFDFLFLVMEFSGGFRNLFSCSSFIRRKLFQRVVHRSIKVNDLII